MIPQMIWLGLQVFCLGVHVASPKATSGSVICGLVMSGATDALLYWGGFFDCFFH